MKNGERNPYSTIPRSHIQQFVTRWCLENPAKGKTVVAQSGNLSLSGDYQLALNDLTQPTNEIASVLDGRAKSAGCSDPGVISAYKRIRTEAQDLVRDVYSKMIDELIHRTEGLSVGGYLKSRLGQRKDNLSGGLATSEKMPQAKSNFITELQTLKYTALTAPLEKLAESVSTAQSMLLSWHSESNQGQMMPPPRTTSHKCEIGNELEVSIGSAEVIEKANRALACLRAEPASWELVGMVSWLLFLEDTLCNRSKPLLDSLKQDQACVRSFFSTVKMDSPAMGHLMKIFKMSQAGLFSGGNSTPVRQPEHGSPAATSAIGRE